MAGPWKGSSVLVAVAAPGHQTLVIEAVRHLVSDHRAHRAVVYLGYSSASTASDHAATTLFLKAKL